MFHTMVGHLNVVVEHSALKTQKISKIRKSKDKVQYLL